MANLGTFAPASLRRAFFVFTAGAALSCCGLVREASAATAPGTKADAPPSGVQMLERAKQAGLRGQYYLEFGLHALPRRGEEVVYKGRLWGTRNAQGLLWRVELTDGAGKSHRLLVQNGEKGRVWRWADGKVVSLGASELFISVLPGVELTPFDLQAPYLYWPNPTLQGDINIRGRKAQAFLFRAPAEFAGPEIKVAAARAYLDSQFSVIMQTELLDATGRALKTMAVQSVKTLGEQQLPKTLDYRNDVTRDKARVEVTAAALDLEFGAGVFEPESLAREVTAPSPVSRFD